MGILWDPKQVVESPNVKIITQVPISVCPLSPVLKLLKGHLIFMGPRDQSILTPKSPG